MICWKCKKENSIEKPARGDECPFCHADLHVCRSCDFYESGAHNDCRETSAEFTGDKERSNFCDYFRVSHLLSASCGAGSGSDGAGDGSDGAGGKSKADAARDAFNALFG